MKNLLIFAIIFICNITFAQVEVKEGIPLEYNDIKEISFKIFKPALRLNKVQKQSNIDYPRYDSAFYDKKHLYISERLGVIIFTKKVGRLLLDLLL